MLFRSGLLEHGIGCAGDVVPVPPGAVEAPFARSPPVQWPAALLAHGRARAAVRVWKHRGRVRAAGVQYGGMASRMAVRSRVWRAAGWGVVSYAPGAVAGPGPRVVRTGWGGAVGRREPIKS